MRVFLTTAIGLLICLLGWEQAIAQEEDLIVYYDFEAIDNGVMLDLSGKGHDGLVNGDIKIVDGGMRGKAAEFDANSFIDLDGPSFPPEHIPTEAITLAAWVKPENTGGHHEIFNARATDGTWIVHPELRDNGVFRWLLRTDGGNDIFNMMAGQVNWGEWLHYAGTYDASGDGILYIDGEEVMTQGSAGRIASDWGQGARVGLTIDNARPFTGLMDDFTIYKRQLSQEEIQLQMAEGPPSLMPVSPVGRLAVMWGTIKEF